LLPELIILLDKSHINSLCA